MNDIIQRLESALAEKDYVRIVNLLPELFRQADEGKIVELPCKVGNKVFVIARCANIRMLIDDGWETGTGAVECPFEAECNFEDCDDAHEQIIETTVTDFWFGTEYGKTFVAELEHMNPVKISDFGRTVFLARESAEKALKESEKS